ANHKASLTRKGPSLTGTKAPDRSRTVTPPITTPTGNGGRLCFTPDTAVRLLRPQQNHQPPVAVNANNTPHVRRLAEPTFINVAKRPGTDSTETGQAPSQKVSRPARTSIPSA